MISTRCCLILEDEALIAFGVADYLEEAGIEVAGPFLSCADALSWVGGRTPSVAILDFELRDGSSGEIARTLLGRGVPVIIHSGHPRVKHRPELDGAAWVEKPIDPAELVQAAARLAPSSMARIADPFVEAYARIA